ncbi:hypothetical protein P153DRAFT_363918 [Dothidotthia symphoricarpi CBS 119687]|uniref:Uncharacterized protein n=1 Tax=Dothidotthia symphoricarpi CBS 119687 TaxID=1392245 RepID=A0A6A6AKY0_9PLEO|nr:uncharacterized protein P153DRAFT_363918 [Dothidotthia symphoricarpi CBS 119687]KAF2132619.1 hypothetical protein P153DRAFT_363918 [Dothidotthia symphoricarpi CBS 119687]
MPSLEDITYSRDETVAAVRDYYQFLTKMYLDETYIIEPPPEGWAHITNRHSTLDKSKEVINLLRHLPYIKSTLDSTVDAEGAPDCTFADWQDIFQRASDRRTITIGTEDSAISHYIPKHVVGLTCGGRHSPRFLLDVKLGIVQWYECPGQMSDNASRETVDDDPYDYCAAEEEAEWRAEGETWSIPDFFEELKEQFRRLNFIPLSGRKVVHVWKISPPDYEAMLVGVQDIYRQHAWPDLERYDKNECLKAVAKFIEEDYAQFTP